MRKGVKIKEELDNCDVYIFEICSIKIYNFEGAYCQFEQSLNNDVSNYNMTIQTEEQLLEDLYTIKSFFPDKKIIFQCHFRPNIIYNDKTKTIIQREKIYDTLVKFCNKNNKCFLYDPSVLLQKYNSLFDGDVHFNDRGFNESFNFLYNNFLTDK